MISAQINYAEAFLTFRCNLGCDYCINKYDGIKENRKEISASQWAKAINRFDWEIPLTLGGGEPTMYRDFYALLNRIKPEIDLELLTNLTFDVDEFIRKVEPERFTQKEKAYKSIRVSYHPAKHNPKELIYKVKKLQDAGFRIGIFGLNYPENMKANMLMSEHARISGVYFFIKDYLGEISNHKFGFLKYPGAISGRRKQVLCRSKDILIGPEGNVYKCHRDLYHDKHKLGNITDPDFKFRFRFRKCLDYGLCNPCDVKARTNRFLQMGDCNVEIVK